MQHDRQTLTQTPQQKPATWRLIVAVAGIFKNSERQRLQQQSKRSRYR